MPGLEERVIFVLAPGWTLGSSTEDFEKLVKTMKRAVASEMGVAVYPVDEQPVVLLVHKAENIENLVCDVCVFREGFRQICMCSIPTWREENQKACLSHMGSHRHNRCLCELAATEDILEVPEFRGVSCCALQAEVSAGASLDQRRAL